LKFSRPFFFFCAVFFNLLIIQSTYFLPTRPQEQAPKSKIELRFLTDNKFFEDRGNAPRAKYLLLKTRDLRYVDVYAEPHIYASNTPHFESSDLDTIPAPILDWNIDRNQIARLGFAGVNITLTFWIDAEGAIEKIVSEDDGLLPTGLEQLLKSIKETSMAPATRGGIPVPCVITFEISLGS